MRIHPLLFVFLALVVASLGVAPAHAQREGTGYGATVPVSDTSDAQRDHAFSVALGDVLTRSAGQDISGAPGYTDALGTASSLVQDYQYRRAAPGAAQPFVLQVQFDAAAVRQLADGLQRKLAGANAEPAPVDGGTPGMDRRNATVWVAPMRSGLDLPRLLAVLRANGQVAAVEPVGADGEGVLLRIHTRSGLSGVIASLQSGGHLQSDASMHPGADVSLRWLR